jgi:hypothetical protein
VRPVLALAVFTGLVLAPASYAKGAGADRPRIAFSVSPARLAIAAPGSRRINVRNDGTEQVVVAVARRAITPQAAGTTLLKIVPGRLLLRSGRSGVLTLRARRPRGAEPGDHPVLVLLTTRSMRSGRVTLHVRLGVRVSVRVPGPIVRHVALGGLRVRPARSGRFMFVPIANRGNVTVELRGQVSTSLYRRGRQVARLRPLAPRALPPGDRALLTLHYRGGLRGPATALVRVRLGPGVRAVERRYRIRL